MNDNFFRRNLIASLLLVTFLFIVTNVSFLYINQKAVDDSWDSLDEVAYASEAKMGFLSHSLLSALTNISAVVSLNEHLLSENMVRMIRTSRLGPLVSKARLYLPSGHIITDQGVLFDSTYVQHYNRIVAQHPYVSKVAPDLLNHEDIVFEQFVPVRQHGQVVGMLSAVSNIKPMYGYTATNAFKGSAILMVVDRRDGSFVVEKTGQWKNFNDFVSKINPNSGYSTNEWASSVLNGGAAHLAYEDEKGEAKLLVSLPLFGDCWSLILVVNENIAFTRVDKIRRFYIAISAIELIVILLYLLRVVLSARRMAEAEKSEYSEIADALSGTYECIFYVNILDDSFDMFHAEQLQNKLHEEWEGRDFFFVSVTNLRRYLYEDDLEVVMHFMEKGNFLKRLEENASASVEFRLVIDGNPQFYRMKAIKSSKDENHVIVAVENIDSEVNKAIAQRQEMDRNNRVIESLASDFDFVNYVTLGEDSSRDFVVTYRASAALLKMIPGWSNEKLFAKRMELLFKYLVSDFDKAQFYEQTSRDKLVSRLKHESVVHVNFKVKLEGKDVYYQMKIIADKDELGNLKGIVFGLHSVDDEIKTQMEIQAKLKRNLEIIDILSEDYTSLFFFNLQDNTSGVLAVRKEIKESLSDLFVSCDRLEDVFKAFVLDQVHPDDREKLIGLASREYVAQELSHQKRITVVFRHLYGNEYKYSRLVFAKAEPVDVPPKLIAVGFVEVDAQYRAEKEHQENIERIMSLSDQFEVVYDVNIDTGFFSVSLKGGSFSDVVDEQSGEGVDFFKTREADIRKIVYQEDQENVLKALDRKAVIARLQNENSYFQDYRRVTPEGLKWYRMRVTKMGDWSKSHRVLVGLLDNDAVYRKEMEQQEKLERALEMAKSASRAKTMFLNSMSHDIRTPMNAIIGYTELATIHIANQDLVRNFLGKIELSSNHLLSLINDVLDMSRIESGKLSLNEKSERIPDLIHTLKDIVQADIHSKHLQFYANSIDIKNEEIICDKLRLNQVLLNVVSNAIKYTPAEGSIWLTVAQEKSTEPDVGSFVFIIRDSGIGMSEDFLPSIFDPFTRVNSSTVSGIQGTGLGMAITKNIVDMMKGSIEIHSKENEGTEVVLKFNFKIADSSQGVERIKELEGKRILVVDDDEESCKHAPGNFKEIGIEAVCCNSGEKALEMAKAAKDGGTPYDAYLIDWCMPHMDGMKTIKKLREMLGNDIVVIVMSAYEWSDIEDDASKARVCNFISKPLFPSDVKEALLTSFGYKHSAVQESGKNVNFNGKKVLLVDDNELNRENAQEILEDCGIQVTAVCDGEKAVEYIKNAKPSDCDLVLMDVQMPIMDGYEATRQIRKLDCEMAKVPIIAMTANAFADDQLAAIEAGMNEHVAKPVNVNKLKEVLSRFL